VQSHVLLNNIFLIKCFGNKGCIVARLLQAGIRVEPTINDEAGCLIQKPKPLAREVSAALLRSRQCIAALA
jgi:hypothetical protein